MKEQKWDDSIVNTREFFEAATILPDEDSELELSISSGKSQFTKLRRRIEERLDSKRIALEYDYDDIDDLPGSLQ